MMQLGRTMRNSAGFMIGVMIGTTNVQVHASPFSVMIAREYSPIVSWMIYEIGSLTIPGFKVIALWCPSENGGVLEVRAKNPSGYIARNRTFFRNDKAIRIVSEIKAPDQAYTTDEDVDPAAEIIKTQSSFDQFCTGNKANVARLQSYLKSSRSKILEAGGTISHADINK